MKRLILAAVLTLFAFQAMADDQASLRLNWVIYGFHTPFLLGVQRGYYKQQGIDLTIGEGKGSASTVQVVASGGDTFGLSDSSSIITGAVRGAPVRAVMAITNRSPYTVEVRRDAGITKFQDLAGKTLATATGEAGLVLFPAVLKAQHMAPDAVTFLRIDPNAKMPAVLQNQVIGMLGGLDNESLMIPRKGVPIVDFPYADLGVNTIGLCIQTSEATIAQHPDLIGRFIAATRQSFEAAAADPEASVAAGQKVSPDLDHDLALAQLKAGLALMPSPREPDKPVGWMSPQDWDDTVALMVQYRDLKTDKPASAFWTAEFLPKSP
jgi:NitT/TauT family transport system substrate-binding protein